MRTNRSVLRSAAHTGSSCAPLPIEAEMMMKRSQGGEGGGEGSVCPVIFGKEAYEAQRRRETAAIDRKDSGGVAKL